MVAEEAGFLVAVQPVAADFPAGLAVSTGKLAAGKFTGRAVQRSAREAIRIGATIIAKTGRIGRTTTVKTARTMDVSCKTTGRTLSRMNLMTTGITTITIGMMVISQPVSSWAESWSVPPPRHVMSIR